MMEAAIFAEGTQGVYEIVVEEDEHRLGLSPFKIRTCCARRDPMLLRLHVLKKKIT